MPNWREALKLWNDGKEYWAIPRKNTASMGQVRILMENKPVVRVEAAPTDPRIQEPSLLPYEDWGRRHFRLMHSNFLTEKAPTFHKHIFDKFKNHYNKDMYKTMNADEKLYMFNDIYTILNTRHAGNSLHYKFSKDKYDAFEIPKYAQRGYEKWLVNKDWVGRYNKGRKGS